MLSSLTIYMIVTWAAMTHTIYLVPEKQPLSTIIARVTPDVLPNTKIANLVSHLGKEEQLYGYVQMDSYPYISVDFQTGDVYTTTNTIKGCSSHDRCLFTFTVWVLHFKSSSHTEFRGQIELVFNAQASTTANIVEVVEYARDAQVIVSAKVNAELGKNATLSCTLQVDGFIHLTQSSWERQLPTGPVTVAVFNPVFGVHILPEYSQRLSYRSPLTYDATIVLGALALEDVGNYTCKMTTFPLGVLQASTTVSVLEASQGFQPAAPALYSIITASE